jgi:hypothetical protein
LDVSGQDLNNLNRRWTVLNPAMMANGHA